MDSVIRDLNNSGQEFSEVGGVHIFFDIFWHNCSGVVKFSLPQEEFDSDSSNIQHFSVTNRSSTFNIFFGHKC